MERRWNRTWGTVARRRTRVVLEEHRRRLTCTHTFVSPDRVQRAAYYRPQNDLDHWLALDRGNFRQQPGDATVQAVNSEADSGWDIWRSPRDDHQRTDALHGDKKQKWQGPRAKPSPNRLMTVELTADVSPDVIEMRQNRQKEGWIDTSSQSTWVSHCVETKPFNLHIAVNIKLSQQRSSFCGNSREVSSCLFTYFFYKCFITSST